MSKEESDFKQIKTTSKTTKSILYLLIIFLGVIIVLATLGYFYGWAFVGVVEYDYNSNGSLKGVKDIKTLWDWLDLFIAPFIIALGIWWLTHLEELRKQKQEEFFKIEQKTKTDLETKLSEIRLAQENLNSYFDQITSLVLEKNLLASHNTDIVRTIARARTLATLRTLDGTRKGRLVRFLAEANLIERTQPVLVLSGADLRHTQLRKATLSNKNLSRTNLSSAILTRINLSKTHLNRCSIIKADISYADLQYSKLIRSKLDQSNFTGSNLSNANLIKASFKGADLRNTIFTSAKVNGADFTNADLCGATFTNVNLSGANLHNVKHDATTIWPNDFDLNEHLHH